MALKFFNRKENKIQSIYFQIFAYKYIYIYIIRYSNQKIVQIFIFISAIILR